MVNCLIACRRGECQRESGNSYSDVTETLPSRQTVMWYCTGNVLARYFRVLCFQEHAHVHGHWP